MTNEQAPNEWFSIERLLLEHNITAIEAAISGGTLQAYDVYDCLRLANDHDANDNNSIAFALQLLAKRKNRLDKDRPYSLYYSDYDEDESLKSTLNRFGWPKKTLPTFPPRWIPLVRYLGQGTAKLATSIKDGNLQIYNFDGLTLDANNNDCSDANSKAFVLKILADRQERLHYPEPEYEQLHNYCTEDEMHSLERFGWYEDSLPQFHLINPHFSPLNEAPQGVTGSSLEVRTGILGLRDADAKEWFDEKSKDDKWSIENMTEPQVIGSLKARDVGKKSRLMLWRLPNAYPEWNRNQQIWPKRKAGKKQLLP